MEIKLRQHFLAILLVSYGAVFTKFIYQYFVVFPQTPTFAKTFKYSPTTEKVLDELDKYGKENQIESIIAQRDIWLDIPRYIFYYLGAKTPPTEMNLTEDILNEVRFGNIHFSFMPGRDTEYCSGLSFCPEEINDQDIFIVDNQQVEYLDRLQRLGLNSIYQDDAFTILLKTDSLEPD